jgi:hypothetical protein
MVLLKVIKFMFKVLNQIPMIDVNDRKNYKWVKSFNPNSTDKAILRSRTIIGGSIGGTATAIIILSLSYSLYRRKRTVIYTPKHAISNC